MMVTAQRPLQDFFVTREDVATGAVDNEEVTRKPKPLASSFSAQEAVEYLEGVIRALPDGTTFTSMALFREVKLRGDKRARGVVINALQRLGLITVEGITTRDQEGRNNGYAVLWRVVK